MRALSGTGRNMASMHNEPMSYLDFIRGEAWMAGAYGGGYAKSRPWLGYLRLLIHLVPHIRVGRFDGEPFVELTATKIPMRRYSESIWILGILIAKDDNGWHTMRMCGPL